MSASSSSESTVVDVTVLPRAEIIKLFAVKPGDTGSPEVQCALLTERISKVAKHLGDFSKDHHSKVGMLRLVSRRKSQLSYLQKESPVRYKTLIKRLGLRK